MIINIKDIDVNKLRRDIIEELNATIYMVSKIAIAELSQVENYTDEQVVEYAKKNGYNLNNYLKKY